GTGTQRSVRRNRRGQSSGNSSSNGFRKRESEPQKGERAMQNAANGSRYNKGAMAIHLEAVYEQGVLRSLEPLALAEHQRVHVPVEEGKRPLSWESAQQPDDSRAELDWLANESRHYT